MSKVYAQLFILILTLVGCHPHLEMSNSQSSNSDVIGTEPKSEIASIISPYRDQLQKEMDVVLCSNARDMERARPESAIGNFFSDACLAFARAEFDVQIDAAMFNHGGIRSTMAAGEITVGDIFSVMPFENELVVVELDKAAMQSLLMYHHASGGEPVGDMRIAFENGALTSAHIGDKSYKEMNRFFILTSNYLANGGDRMNFFTEDERISIFKTGVKVRDALISHCRSLGQSEDLIDYQLEGRMQFK